MPIQLPPKIRKMVEKRMKEGGYRNPEDVLMAGLTALERTEKFGDFATGELDALIAEGEASIRTEGTVTLEESFRTRKQRRSRRLRKTA